MNYEYCSIIIYESHQYGNICTFHPAVLGEIAIFLNYGNRFSLFRQSFCFTEEYLKLKSQYRSSHQLKI